MLRFLPSSLGFCLLMTAALAHGQGGAGGRSAPATGGARPASVGPTGAIAGNGGANVLVIVMAPSVQKELKLTDAQKDRIYELTREAGQRSRELFQSMLRPGGANPQAMMMAGESLRRENERAVADILEAKQKERFNQIALQVEGPLAVSRQEVGQAVRLTPAQNQQVQQLMMQLVQSQRQLMMAARAQGAYGAGQLDNSQFNSLEQNATKLREAAAQQVGRILDGKQKVAFNKLLGEPFDVSGIVADGAGWTGGFKSASESDKPQTTSASKKGKTKGTTRRAAPAKKATTSADGSEKP